VPLAEDTDIYYLTKDSSKLVVLGVRTFSDKAYQSYYKVLGGDTYYGKKQPNTEGFKSTASDPKDTANAFSVWSRASAKGADEVVLPEPDIIEPPVVSQENVALNTIASQSTTDRTYSTADKAVDGRKSNCNWNGDTPDNQVAITLTSPSNTWW